MDNKIKRIIAREGLIIIGIMVFSLCFYWLIELMRHLLATYFMSKVKDIKDINGLPNLMLFAYIKDFSILILVVSYPAYLMVRFILWAVKILKQK